MKDPLYKSFGYAFRGIWATIRSERNIKIHCAVAALVVVFGLWLGLSKMEWMICFILFGQVISLELVNTALEAGKAKDAAAGAVLVSAIFAAVIGLMIFVPKLAALV